jgi:hypothetical protein
MKYALANMLNGAGGLNADQLALDLQFAADKTLTARKGPTPTFTRASSGTFVGSNGLVQTAGNNVARFDHNPVTLASRGLLIEESRTNQSLYSGALVNGTGWSAISTTSIIDGLSPDGNDAYLVSEAVSTAVHTLGNTGGLTSVGSTSVTSGTTYTGSIFIKKVSGSVDWIQVTLGSGGFGVAQYANFNIGNGTIGNSAGLASGTSPRIENYGNGWYRCSISASATATTTTSVGTIISFINNTNGTSRTPSYAGSTSNQVIASMCQFEAGSFATSYIPTTTSSVVRSADVCSISGAAFSGFYNATEGTSFVSAIKNTNTGNPRLLVITNGTSGNRVDMTRATSAEQIDYYAGGSFLHTLNLGSIATGVNYKIAHAMAANNFAASRDGLTPVTNNSGVMVTADRIIIGATFNGAANFFNGTISAIRYYRKRLPNAKLQALTV